MPANGTTNLADIRPRIEAGEPLTFEEGLRLYESPDIHTLGELANGLRERLNGRRAYYNINHHINYTNYCVLRCRFCSFYQPYRKRRSYESPPDRSDIDDAYELSIDEIVDRAKLAYLRGATEVHIVGGLHPKLPFSYYTGMCAAIRQACPHMHIKAFTAIEIIHFSRIARPRMTIAEVLTELRKAGLGSLPGGGAEIFDDRVHDEAFKNKVGEAEWFDVHRTAHNLGIFTNATMLYGHVETPADRVTHLIKLREQQEESLRSRRAHFNCVVPLSFIPKGSALEHLPGPSGLDDLRTLAISRLLCPNIEHIKAFWIMLTPKLAQVSLNWGVDDIDGTVGYYDITKSESQAPNAPARFRTTSEPQALACAEHRRSDPPSSSSSRRPIAPTDSASADSARAKAHGSTHQELTVDELKRVIVEAGCKPVERDTLYRRIIRDETTWRIEGEPWSVVYDPTAVAKGANSDR